MTNSIDTYLNQNFLHTTQILDFYYVYNFPPRTKSGSKIVNIRLSTIMCMGMMNDDSLPMTIQYTNFYVHMTLSLPYHNNRFIRSKLTLNCNFLFNKVQGTEKIK